MDLFSLNLDKWHTVTEQTAEFFLRESEKYLEQTNITFNMHREKTFKLLGFLLPVLAAVVGYSASANFSEIIPILLFIFIEVAGIAFLISVIIPRGIYPIGAEPREIIVPECIIEDENYQYKGMLISVCERIQDKINSNNKQNQLSGKLLTTGIILCGIIAPITYLVAVLVAAV